MKNSVGRTPWFKTGIVVAFSLLFFAGWSAQAQGEVYSGVLDVYADDDGTVTEATLDVESWNETTSYQLVLDKKMVKVFEELQGEEVQVWGKVVEKDSELWIEVEKCLPVFFGVVQCNRDDDGNLEYVLLETDFDTYSLPLDKKAQELASKYDGKTIRIVGSLKETDEGEQLVIDGFAEFVTAHGRLEVTRNDEGAATAIRFVCKMDGKPAAFDLPVNESMIAMAERYEWDMVEISGTVGNDKGRNMLSVMTCDMSTQVSDEDEMAEEEGRGEGSEADDD
jgi:hypothetical protein